jgi:hypothetical protein
MTKIEAQKIKKLDKTAKILEPRSQDNQITGYWVSVRNCVTGRFAEAVKATKF